MSDITPETKQRPQRAIPFGLTLGAIGVVFGDIGTSPLYAMKECFHPAHGITISHANILGVLSLILWSLVVTITIKYLVVVMRADNRGEGGVLALMALACPAGRRPQERSAFLILPGLFGAALLYGDGIITPAISVLSAIEGLNVATLIFEPYVQLITIAILLAVFYVQSHGTSRIGSIFGPIVVVWYIAIALLGIAEIFKVPGVLYALNPWYAVSFFLFNGHSAFLTLGAVFLVVTGGEALYADMGHFGRLPIQIGWYFVALPGLVLNYFGQGALLMNQPGAITNPFYLLAPAWALYPMVVLSAAATVIASQAIISGAFSLTRQAIQLGYLPRMEIRHTSSKEIGQIYVAQVNWILLIATIILVLNFQTSSNLAAAYGIAVSMTMVITTFLIYFVARRQWGISGTNAMLLTAPFLLIDITFFGANIVKISDGGWVPLVLAGVIFSLMTTWLKGREILASRLSENLMPLSTFVQSFGNYPRTSGTAVFLTRNLEYAPPALLHNVKHNRVLHEQVLLLFVQIEEVPSVSLDERLQIERLDGGFYRIVAYFGYRDVPDIPDLMCEVEKQERSIRAPNLIYFIGRETLFATSRPGMMIWRERLFAFMSRNAQSATKYFKLPSDRVVEIGLQIEL